MTVVAMSHGELSRFYTLMRVEREELAKAVPIRHTFGLNGRSDGSFGAIAAYLFHIRFIILGEEHVASPGVTSFVAGQRTGSQLHPGPVESLG